MRWRWTATATNPIPNPIPNPSPNQVDGYGNHFFGDDANVPSLLSLPYVGYLPPNDPVHRGTRHPTLVLTL